MVAAPSAHSFSRGSLLACFTQAANCASSSGSSRQKEVRYLDIYEDDPLDEAQFAAWVKQASKLPREKL